MNLRLRKFDLNWKSNHHLSCLEQKNTCILINLKFLFVPKIISKAAFFHLSILQSYRDFHLFLDSSKKVTKKTISVNMKV